MSLPLGVFFGSFLSRERNERKEIHYTVILFVNQTVSFVQAVAVVTGRRGRRPLPRGGRVCLPKPSRLSWEEQAPPLQR